jgi:thiol-disulfide isomerase/thioredoxin
VNVATFVIALAGVLIAIFFVLVPAGQSRLKPSGSTTGHLALGQPAPAFSLKSLDGGTVQLATYSGKPLLVNVWATWCVPCRQEMPAIQRAYDRYHPQGLQALAIDELEGEGDITSFATKIHVSLPIAIDDGSFSQAYGVGVMPTSIFVDAHGIVRAVELGAMTDAKIQQNIDLILQR